MNILKHQQKSLFWLLGCLFLFLLVFCLLPKKSSLQIERKKLLEACHSQFNQVDQDGHGDTTQIEMTETSRSMWEVAEAALPRAAALRLRISPEDAEIILQDVYGFWVMGAVLPSFFRD